MVGINLFPLFKQLEEYGNLMAGVISVIVAVIVLVILFEILAKIFLLRSILPSFSRPSGGRGYTAMAKILVISNLCAVLLNLLSAGGESATLLNQGYLYLQILLSVVEVAVVCSYLRTVNK